MSSTHTHTKPAQWINYNHSKGDCVYGLLIGSDRGCGDVLITPGFLPFPTASPDTPRSLSSAWHFYLCTVVTCHSSSCLLAHHYWHESLCTKAQNSLLINTITSGQHSSTFTHLNYTFNTFKQILYLLVGAHKSAGFSDPTSSRIKWIKFKNVTFHLSHYITGVTAPCYLLFSHARLLALSSPPLSLHLLFATCMGNRFSHLSAWLFNLF